MSRQEEHELTHATQITVSFRSTQGIKNYLSQPKKKKKRKKCPNFQSIAYTSNPTKSHQLEQQIYNVFSINNSFLIHFHGTVSEQHKDHLNGQKQIRVYVSALTVMYFHCLIMEREMLLRVQNTPLRQRPALFLPPPIVC